jgi:lipoate-protein ligase A
MLSENSKWEYIDSGFGTGKYNMDFDLELVERCKADDVSFLRFYRWKPYAISLGYNQSANDFRLNYQKCNDDGIDVVTRPTGGRAVLHSDELTYSVVFKSARPVRDLYRDISLDILNGLKTLDPNLNDLAFTKETPDLLKLAKTGMYNLCFNSQVKYEINHKGRKLVGSAQRKFGNIVLQHGSILIGNHHKNIVNYLNISDNEKAKMLQEIEEKTVCLNNLISTEMSYEAATNAVLGGFKSTFNIDFIPHSEAVLND